MFAVIDRQGSMWRVIACIKATISILWRMARLWLAMEVDGCPETPAYLPLGEIPGPRLASMPH